jgi:hypothetical protein
MPWPFKNKKKKVVNANLGRGSRRSNQQKQAAIEALNGGVSAKDLTYGTDPGQEPFAIPVEGEDQSEITPTEKASISETPYQAPQPVETVQPVKAPQPAPVPKKITSEYLLETYLPDKLMANRTAFDVMSDKTYTTPNSRCYISVRDDALILVSLKHRRASVVFGFQTEYDCKDNKYAEITERILPRVKETGLEPELDAWGTIDDKTVFTLGLPFELNIESIGGAVDNILKSYNGIGLLDMPEGELIRKMGAAIGQAEPPQVITGVEAMNLYNRLLQE